VADNNNDNSDLIIQGCIRKDEKAQEMLYKKYFGYALSVALLYSCNRNDAVEIVDDSFIKVFLQIKRYDRSSGSFKGWLRRIVINTAVDRFRRYNRPELAGVTEAIPVSDDSPGIISQLTAKEIIDLLNYLPHIHKAVFCLYVIEGFSHTEIADRLKIPESSSRVYLTRAKKQLRELCEKHSITHG
jgi:RNA polymerase sigma-70 factor (ECF subfamily)